MCRCFKSFVLVVLALALISPSFVPLNAAPTRASLDVWRPATYKVEVTALAVSPASCSDQTLCAASDGAGVFWSQDAGEHWNSMNKGLGNLYVLSLAMDYAQDGTLFAGTNGDGVFKWNKGQDRWDSAGLIETAGLTETIVDALVVSPPYPHDGGTPVLKEDVFAGTDSGVFKGVFNPDNGEITWTLTLSHTWVCALAISPNYITDSISDMDKTVFAGAPSGLYISQNGGVTWTQILSDTWVCSLAVSPNYGTDKTIFVGTYDVSPRSYSKVSPRQIRSSAVSSLPQGRGQVIKIELNMGTAVTKTVCGEVKGPVNALAVFPDAICQPVILAGTPYGIFRFCQCNDPQPRNVLNQEVNAFAVGPDCAAGRVIFAGGPAGVFKSADESETWTECGKLASLVVNAITLSPNYDKDRTIFAATPRDGVLISKDRGLSWISRGLIDYDVRSLVAVSCYTDTLLAGTWAGGVFTTTCGGNTPWLPTGLGCIHALAAAPDGQGGSVVFAGTCNEGVYKATLTAAKDCQLNWQPSNGGLNYDNIKTLCTSPAYQTDTTVFAGTYLGGIYKSKDGGANWIKVSDVITAPPIIIDVGPGKAGVDRIQISNEITTVLALAASPNYGQDQTVLAGTANGIYKSTNGGNSWTLVGPSCPVYALSFSPDYAKDQTVYAGTCGCGVFESRNGGEAWTAMNAGLDNLCVHSLAITPTRPWTLLAGTEGSGVWLYTVSYKIYLPIIMHSYAW
jgi:photosystem II stability/assembly factor-like uncharacterized protein